MYNQQTVSVVSTSYRFEEHSPSRNDTRIYLSPEDQGRRISWATVSTHDACHQLGFCLRSPGPSVPDGEYVLTRAQCVRDQKGDIV